METTVDLEPEAYQEAQRQAAERGLPLGRVLSDLILKRPTNSEEIKAMIAEDQEWEITRGDPNHPHYKAATLPIATLTKDDQGFPQIDIGRMITLEEVRTVVEED